MANPNVRLALRVHDECNGQLSSGPFLPDPYLHPQLRKLLQEYDNPSAVFTTRIASQNKPVDSEII